MILKSTFNNKNIYFKTGIGLLILSALLIILFILTQEDDYGMIWIILVEPFLVLISVILIIVGWYKSRNKICNSLLIFYVVIFIILISVNITSAQNLEPPLKVAWKSRLGIASTDIWPQSINLIVSDIAYVNYRGLKAIDVNNGKLLWSKDWSAGVVYTDGLVYAARAFSQNLYVIEKTTYD